ASYLAFQLGIALGIHPLGYLSQYAHHGLATVTSLMDSRPVRPLAATRLGGRSLDGGLKPLARGLLAKGRAPATTVLCPRESTQTSAVTGEGTLHLHAKRYLVQSPGGVAGLQPVVPDF